MTDSYIYPFSTTIKLIRILLVHPKASPLLHERVLMRHLKVGVNELGDFTLLIPMILGRLVDVLLYWQLLPIDLQTIQFPDSASTGSCISVVVVDCGAAESFQPSGSRRPPPQGHP